MLRSLLVFWLIFYSLRYRTKPWNFFQLNHTYFNKGKNIFSKLDLDRHIPAQWRLQQCLDDGEIVPEFPLFVKPEWGQNSHGVGIAQDINELNALRGKRKETSVAYLLQEAAKEEREFEFFYIRRAENLIEYETISLTETINSSNETLVVNGINNVDSVYRDLDCDLSDEQRSALWRIFSSIGCFGIARVGVKANSLADLIEGSFHVVEVNIFLPMPLILLDKQKSLSAKVRFIRRAMKGAAKLASKVDISGPKRCPIFYKQLVAHYKVKE